MKITLYFILIMLIFSCGSSPEFIGRADVGSYSYKCSNDFTGKIEAIDKLTKKKIKELHIKDGNLHGISTTWNKDGKKLEQIEYKNGKANGIEILWDVKGNKIRQKSYLDGKEDGSFYIWHENGSLKSETIYKLGVIINSTEWNEDNFKVSNYTYVLGDLSKIEEWKKNGNYIVKNYINRSDFICTSFDKNGNKIEEYKNINGKTIGYKDFTLKIEGFEYESK